MTTKKEQRLMMAYPNTDTFTWYNANPKGKIIGDCVLRAISTAEGESWETTYKKMFDLSVKRGEIFNDKKFIEAYLKSIGYTKMKQPRKTNNKKYTGSDWCKELQRIGNTKTIIANIGGHHIVCIKDNKVLDIWNSTCKCIGNYWIRVE